MSKEFTTLYEEKEEHGIFFRNPFQKVTKEAWASGGEESCYEWRNRAPFQVIPFLLNLKVWFKSKEWMEDDNFAALRVWELCSPIYFKRQSRCAVHKFHSHPVFNEIVAYGWEPYKNHCGGAAEKEITTFEYTDGTIRKMVNKGEFHFIYRHIIEEGINRGKIE